MKRARELKRLGNSYEERGDYESAELLFRKALSMQEKQLGNEHPSIASDLYNLGLLCYALQKYNDAELFLMRAWAIERKSLGLMHPETLSTLEALSEIHYDPERSSRNKFKDAINRPLRSGTSSSYCCH